MNLATFKSSGTFSTGSDPTFGPLFAEDLDVMPGRSDVVVASLRNFGFSPRHEGVWVFDDGVALPNHTDSHSGANRMEFGSPSTVYGYNNETTEFGFRTIAIDAAGAKQTSNESGAITGFDVDIEFAAGLVYSTSGLAVDPITGNAVQSYAGSGLVEVTPGNNRITFVSGPQVSVFNKTTGEPIESRSFSQMPLSARTLVATGTGFAVASEEGVSLLGPSVVIGAVALPLPATSTIDGLRITEVDLAAADVLYDETRSRLYVSVPRGAPGRAEQVVALDRQTGAG